jgi:hypothetical protein
MPADRRRREHRQHPGYVRDEPPPGTGFIEHDVHPQQCPHCGSADLEATGGFEDHFVADIPEPKIEWHRYRRHVHRCRHCQRTCKEREQLSQAAFAQAHQAILDRFDELLLNSHSRQPECVHIWRRLFKHCDELFTFLRDPRVPADNNGSERDIRSLAAARNDGGTHRADWSAQAFGRLKSILVTGMKNGIRFAQYGMEVVRAKLSGQPLPLPLAGALDSG